MKKLSSETAERQNGDKDDKLQEIGYYDQELCLYTKKRAINDLSAAGILPYVSDNIDKQNQRWKGG